MLMLPTACVGTPCGSPDGVRQVGTVPRHQRSSKKDYFIVAIKPQAATIPVSSGQIIGKLLPALLVREGFRMQESVAPILNTLRVLRVFHATLVLSVIVCGLFLRLIPSHPTQLPNFLVLTTAGVLTVAFLGVGLLARLVYLQPALETLRTNPNDVEALVRWRLVSFLSAVLAESASWRRNSLSWQT